MATPPAKKPKLEENNFMEGQEERSLTLKLSKPRIFLEIMKAWYRELRGREKARLSAKTLKRKAMTVCYSLRLVYDHLPMDWVDVLKRDEGLKLYARSSKLAKERRPMALERYHDGTKRLSRRCMLSSAANGDGCDLVSSSSSAEVENEKSGLEAFNLDSFWQDIPDVPIGFGNDEFGTGTLTENSVGDDTVFCYADNEPKKLGQDESDVMEDEWQ